MSLTMINKVNFRYITLAIISVFVFQINASHLFAQKAKKNKARLSVQYVKVMDEGIYFDIKASTRIKKKTVKISNIEVVIYNVLEDEKVTIGKAITNNNGESRFAMKNINLLKPDTSNTYNFLFSFKGNDAYKKAKKSIEFKDANIKAKIITKDSINYISATLTDGKTNESIENESLTVQIKRLFKSLPVGEEFNNTDEEGTILVPIEKGIPGIEGNLTVEVILNESDDYGTIKSMATGTIGIPIVNISTFDQRTMWSPRNKTPIFLLIFPNLIIFSIWGIIIYLIINLFKLSKS